MRIWRDIIKGLRRIEGEIQSKNISDRLRFGGVCFFWGSWGGVVFGGYIL